MLMTIAVDIRHPGNNHLNGYTSFLHRVLEIVATRNQRHEFIFISDRPTKTKILYDKNVTAVIAGPRGNNFLLRKLWYDIKLPALLKKHSADVFIAGNGICSLNTFAPQCLIINDLSFLHFPSLIKGTGQFYLNRQRKKFLERANSIVTFSEIVKKKIVSRYAAMEEKITVVPPAGKIFFYPLDENKKEEVKKKYTAGKNYFLYAGDIHPEKNLINLLKAFSVFKKRQKSDWKLVIGGSLGRNFIKLADILRTYKYRNDVIMTGDVEEEEIENLTGSAYAIVNLSLWDANGLIVLDAINSHIPVITSGNSYMQEIAGDAALYADPANYSEIADMLMLLYKDESLRNSLIEKGKIVATQYNWEKTADLFWQSILKACPVTGNTVQ